MQLTANIQEGGAPVVNSYATNQCWVIEGWQLSETEGHNKAGSDEGGDSAHHSIRVATQQAAVPACLNQL